MIFATKTETNIRIGGFGQIPAKPDCNLAGMDKIFESFFRFQVSLFDAKIITNRFLNQLNRNFLMFFTEDILEILPSHVERNGNIL